MGGNARSLQNYIYAGTYFTAYAAQAINNNMVIVGWAYNSFSGQYKAFILSPP